MKILLPLIAAILILGAIAIFGGMALNNHNDSKSDDQKQRIKVRKTQIKKMVRNPKITKTKNLILIRTQMMTLIIVPQILTLLQLIITIMQPIITQIIQTKINKIMQTKIAIINRQLKVNNHIQYTVKKTYIVSPYNIMEKELKLTQIKLNVRMD